MLGTGKNTVIATLIRGLVRREVCAVELGHTFGGGYHFDEGRK
jgi:hypothetical protein